MLSVDRKKNWKFVIMNLKELKIKLIVCKVVWYVIKKRKILKNVEVKCKILNFCLVNKELKWFYD